MTAKSETLKMTLGQASRSASLTTLQKAGIYRKAMEEMRDHLEREHVRYQRSDPDATYMIEGLVEIYEVVLSDFVVHGVPQDVGSREHVEARFPGLTDEQRNSLIEFFADQPGWRERARTKAACELDAAGVAETDDNLDIARKVSLERQLSATLEYRRRLADPASMWSGMTVDHDMALPTSVWVQAHMPTETPSRDRRCPSRGHR